MLRSLLFPALLALGAASACGNAPMKEFHLTIIGEMEAFPELDTWTPVAAESAAEDAAAAERALRAHYADIMDLVRPKSVVALSRLAQETMADYDRVPELTSVKLTPVAESEDRKLLLLAGVWEQLPTAEPVAFRRLMIYPIYERSGKKVTRMTVTIRSEKTE
jgi:hypothetical protein